MPYITLSPQEALSQLAWELYNAQRAGWDTTQAEANLQAGQARLSTL